MNSLAQRRHVAAGLLDDYTSARGMYAFRTYDARPANDRGRLRPEDILAANLLSLRLSASDVIPLFAKGEGAPQELLESMNAALSSLREARAFEEYESTNKLDLALTSLKRANEAARKVDGWTSVTVSKVLHRHVPRVVPIIDSRVRRFYGVNKQQDGKLYHQLWEDVRVNGDGSPNSLVSTELLTGANYQFCAWQISSSGCEASTLTLLLSTSSRRRPGIVQG